MQARFLTFAVIIKHPVLGALHIVEFPLPYPPDKEEPAGHPEKKGENEEEDQGTVHGEILGTGGSVRTIFKFGISNIMIMPLIVTACQEIEGSTIVGFA
jgi:hypothetical protein